MPPRVKDVAEAAGVSTATVSRVLNNDSHLTEETRQKVMQAIKTTGYRMNNIARSLKTRKTRLVGFIVPELANDFFMNIAQGVEDELKASGYSLLVSNADNSIGQQENRIELMVEMCVDGLIIIPCTAEGRSLRRLEALGIPSVLIDRLTDDPPSDAVLVDNREGTFSAMKYLIGQGHRRFGFIGGDLSLTSFRERYEGFLAALDHFGIPLDKEIIRLGKFDVDTGYRFMRELMELPSPPHQIFIANYFLHVGASKYLIDHKKHIPAPMNIAGFDDMALSSILGFSSITISQPMGRMGQEAAQLLLRRIEGDRSDFPEIRRLKTDLIIHDPAQGSME